MLYSSTIPAMSVTLVITVCFMLALRPLAASIGLVDKPGGRKSHVGVVPVIGGAAMFVGAFSGMLLFSGPTDGLMALLGASFLLTTIGLIDDKFALPASVRLATQIAVTLIMIFGAGLELQTLGDPLGIGPIDMGPLTIVFTIVVALTVINAYNLVDGVDGLAGSMALIALLSFASVAGYESPLAGLSLIISSAIVGFLAFNFPTPWNRPIRSFMGDAGSTLLGFTLVWVALSVSQGETAVVSPVTCLWFAALPVFDCLTCFVRRAMKGKSPFQPGRDHFHHHLIRGGMGVRRVLGVLTGYQLLYAFVGLAGHWFGVPDVVMFALWAVAGLSQRKMIEFLSKHHRRQARNRRTTIAA